MKNSILILGIALISFSGNAKNTVNNRFCPLQNTTYTENNCGDPNKATKFEKPSLLEDSEIFNPETVIAYNPKTVEDIIKEGDKIVEKSNSANEEYELYEESMKALIAQNDLIIENTISNETRPLYIERTIEDKIAELELIIESTETNEVQPLDFNVINGNSVLKNSFNAEKFIGMN
ncbi:hypothetical protein [Flavobacterium sp.]|uniref:hypothetical protein n=1 Tax=Flavobacterium sp. TaxID=239 RepID=UPI002C1B276E|nr:hypothetical protein [Flavobacterium sp.]HSD07710.1 hypothetical protein [Flavobacterium sp.]